MNIRKIVLSGVFAVLLGLGSFYVASAVSPNLPYISLSAKENRMYVVDMTGATENKVIQLPKAQLVHGATYTVKRLGVFNGYYVIGQTSSGDYLDFPHISDAGLVNERSVMSFVADGVNNRWLLVSYNDNL